MPGPPRGTGARGTPQYCLAEIAFILGYHPKSVGMTTAELGCYMRIWALGVYLRTDIFGPEWIQDGYKMLAKRSANRSETVRRYAHKWLKNGLFEEVAGGVKIVGLRKIHRNYDFREMRYPRRGYDAADSLSLSGIAREREGEREGEISCSNESPNPKVSMGDGLNQNKEVDAIVKEYGPRLRHALDVQTTGKILQYCRRADLHPLDLVRIIDPKGPLKEPIAWCRVVCSNPGRQRDRGVRSYNAFLDELYKQEATETMQQIFGKGGKGD